MLWNDNYLSVSPHLKASFELHRSNKQEIFLNFPKCIPFNTRSLMMEMTVTLQQWQTPGLEIQTHCARTKSNCSQFVVLKI